MSSARYAVVALLANACGGLVVADTGQAPSAAIAADAGVESGSDPGIGSGTGAAGSVVLFSGEPAYTLVVDGAELFFTTTDPHIAVKKCSVDDCSAPTLVGTGGEGLPGLAVDANNVYWSGYNVLKCPRTGCGSAPVQLAPNQGHGIVSDGTDVFFAADRTVWKCAAAGCGGAPTPLASVPPNPGGFTVIPNGVAIDAATVYFTSDHGGVGKCAKSGCSAPTILAPGPYQGADIAVDATDVYWASREGVFRCAIAGCNGSPTMLAASQAYSLSIDETNVYFTMLDGIMKCAKSGCVEPTVLAPATIPGDIAVDATSVYWTNRGDVGEIRKTRKN